MGALLRFFLEQKLVTFLLVLFIVGLGVAFAPFDWDVPLPRSPVPVDAIPDIGENQQIVFTSWPGRSPEDVEDQITYPLTVSLMGLPGVKAIRSYSFFGFSSIYVVFDEKVDFYWSRSRILEKLNSLPAGTLPEGVSPMLGPDATALGQIFWYTLEGCDRNGKPTGGWDLDELRTVQDWYVRFALMSVPGVAEVASVGGFQKEYQVDVDPDRLRYFDVSLGQMVAALKKSNLDVGARTIEVNMVEYVVRGVGFVKKVEDLENAVIAVRKNVPVRVRDVAVVSLGPALRRGMLDKGGAEAVGGVVVVRYGENPLKVIKAVKRKIAEISPSLPKKVLPDGRVSQVRIVPFYDRTDLIHQTLETLNEALSLEILITIIVIVLMIRHLRTSLVISLSLPLAVLVCFIAMKAGGVDANIVSLSGIAIAIGTIVDMGIVICENIVRHLESDAGRKPMVESIFEATREVAGAVVTAISTTVVGFLPVFAMSGPEGKLFKPLAYTKTFALIASVIVALTVLPAVVHLLFGLRLRKGTPRRVFDVLTVLVGTMVAVGFSFWWGVACVLVGVYRLFEERIPVHVRAWSAPLSVAFAAVVAGLVLAGRWMPLGVGKGTFRNVLFVGLVLVSILGAVKLFLRVYPYVLRYVLGHKKAFLAAVVLVCVFGVLSWKGVGGLLDALPSAVGHSRFADAVRRLFPGMGREFLPPLDEGAFLYMPTTMPHASIGTAKEILRKQDMAISAVPEVETVVGKVGRVQSPLDPAPVSMIETVVQYKPEYLRDADGSLVLCRFDPDGEDYFRDVHGNVVPGPDGRPIKVKGRYFWENGRLVRDPHGVPFRLWRPHIRSPRDIWNEIVRAAKVPGVTDAPFLQPIAARIVMLQTGMRAPIGIKVLGPDLVTINRVAADLEKLLKSGAVPSVNPASVVADRVIGKPYIEVDWDREALARYGISIQRAQRIFQTAVGGMIVTRTVEGRERYGVRLRYRRELRDSPESIGRTLVTAADGSQIPLIQLVRRKAVVVPSKVADGLIGEKELFGALSGLLGDAGVPENEIDAGSDMRFPVVIRDAESWEKVIPLLSGRYVETDTGVRVPLQLLLDVSFPRMLWFKRGPMVVKSENTKLVAYVLFDKKTGYAEVDTVEDVKRFLEEQERVFLDAYEKASAGGRSLSPAEVDALPGFNRRGCQLVFAGNYENQVRSQRTLSVVIPLALFVIFLILYFQFRSVGTTLMVFSGILVAWSGAFVLMYLYGCGWFMNVSVFGVNLRDLFHISPMNLSVAVWVGFLALFGIASDNGVIVATYLDQRFSSGPVVDLEDLRERVMDAAIRRVRPCMMTTATTVIALLPVFTATGKGADIMIPMAVPSFGGMLVAVITTLLVPVLYAWREEWKLRRRDR